MVKDVNTKSLLEIEKELIKKKDWKYLGEVDKKKRPLNSLLTKNDFSYDVTEQIESISQKQNVEIMKMALLRVREGTFDNYDFTVVEKQEEEIEYNEEENKDVVELYNEIESELLKISDFGSFGFMPDVEIKNYVKNEIKDKRRKNVKSLGNIKNVTVLK
ncbi:U3 small nucleolar RNA-associated protein (MPP10) [Vairimorpha necatrix]|uniref:U3 small nucleolar RNA-associated protein (MPP10) n=1 Tax=Vairimorpha necatrix TaxID=6039 RepID=A0AAX4JD65_9MICR